MTPENKAQKDYPVLVEDPDIRDSPEFLDSKE
jgi:hypothetical protein